MDNHYVTSDIIRAISRNLLRTRIERLTLFVTNRCPLSCGHCFVDRAKPVADEITIEEAAAIAKTLNPLTWLDIGGGEPFLRDDLVELCQQFNASETDIPTSGWLVEKTVTSARMLAKSVKGRPGISVSVDGFRDTHDRLRQSGSFDRAMETLKALQLIPGLRVSVISTVSSVNWKEIPELVRFISDCGIKGHNINIMRGTPADPCLHLPDEAQLREFRAEMRKVLTPDAYAWKGMFSRIISRLHHLYIERKWSLQMKANRTRMQAVPCLAGRADLVIYANGDVAPCELRPPVGNVRSESLDAILSGHQMLSALQAIRGKQCFCTHECNLLDSTLFNFQTLARLIQPPGDRL